MRTVVYPFVPKSTASLKPGQFWAVPLSNQQFACGRVIAIPESGQPGSRVGFLAGLLDWHGASAPSFNAIAGAVCVEQGKVHLKSITEHGGAILGLRPLELDHIEAFLFRDQGLLPGSHVQRGYDRLRASTLSDESIPVISTWGFNVIRLLAERRFVKAVSKSTGST